MLDTAAVTTPIGRLCEKLKSQFPDLVLVVAGHVEDQAQLTAQITRGVVYRFLNKPVSEQRVRLFVTAAWRRHGVEHQEIIEATATNLRKPVFAPPKPTQKNMLWMGGAAAALVLLIGGIFLFSGDDEKPGPSTSAGTPQSAAAAPGSVDNELEKDSRAGR